MPIIKKDQEKEKDLNQKYIEFLYQKYFIGSEEELNLKLRYK